MTRVGMCDLQMPVGKGRIAVRRVVMDLLVLILLVLSFVCFIVSAFGLVTSARVNLVGLGLAFWVLTVLLKAWPT